ncbi:MAG: hypothetical protein AB8G11_15670 [Saprospiraceae bacterium]
MAKNDFTKKLDNDFIKERSILLGQVAEARAREKRVLTSNRNLKTLLFGSLLLLSISHCWFGRQPKAQLTEKNTATLLAFREAELDIHYDLLRQMITPDSTFNYLIQKGDYPESIAQKFYGNPRYAYMIMLDNSINDDKQLPEDDTIILRYKPEIVEKNQYLNHLN